MNLIDVAKEAALEAGALLEEGFGTTYKVSTKAGQQNLVTEYDISSQKLIIDTIRGHFPHHHFLAEEEDVNDAPSKEIIWIIDPLDGTVNFAHHIPFFAVSIAAARGKELLAGAVYHPLLGELFLAEKGGGAYLNGEKIAVTKTKTFERAMLSTGFPYNIDQNPLHCIDRFSKMASLGAPIRRIGVASLDLAYIAAGRFDAFWEVGLHPWDMAAGKLLIEEAGGKVSLYDGSEHPLYSYVPLLATNGHLHEKMVSYLKEDLR
ncbi:MAG: inositol monophosphatase [Verrucomicrobia bacterium]|nr:inositol monophosphatase [Verrucomicrobiota bacterium]